MPSDLPVLPLRDAVRAELDRAAAEGRDVPSIRTLRAVVKRGSFTAITAFVKEWRLEHAPKNDVKPAGFDETSGKALADAVWRILQPAVTARVTAVQKVADARIEIERTEAQKSLKYAEEMVAEAEAMKAAASAQQEEIMRLREENAQLRGALEAAQKSVENAKADNSRLAAALNKAIEGEAFATATLDAFKAMFPYLKEKMPKKPAK